MKRRFAALAIVASISAACAAIANFDALQPSDGAETGAGDASDANALDGAADDGSPGDASPDGMPPPKNTGSPCDAGITHAFCEDFDREAGGLLAAKWPSRDNTFGDHAFVDATFVSPPLSYRMTPGDAAASSQAFIGLSLTADAGDTFHGKMRLQFDALVTGISGGLYVNQVMFYSEDASASSQWAMTTADLSVGINGATGATGSVSIPLATAASSWNHFDFTYVFSEDGNSKLSGFDADTVAPMAAIIPSPRVVTVQIGVRLHEDGTKPVVQIDNVVIDFEP